jgi:nucleoid DNA-binding protein
MFYTLFQPGVSADLCGMGGGQSGFEATPFHLEGKVENSMATKTAAKKKKAPAKKAVAKKAPAKKATAKKAAPAKAPAKKAVALKDKMTKSQMIANIAESTELSKKQVGDVMAELEGLIERSIKKRAVGEFTLPGLMKITTVKKPARKARKGINPFTGEETVFKAKPASVAVKIRPLKKMKEFAAS